jgi:hypothetical protein
MRNRGQMDALILSACPLAIASAAIVFWWTSRPHERPLSRKAKVIVIAILAWFSLPLVLWLGIMQLTHFGD